MPRPGWKPRKEHERGAYKIKSLDGTIIVTLNPPVTLDDLELAEAKIMEAFKGSGLGVTIKSKSTGNLFVIGN